MTMFAGFDTYAFPGLAQMAWLRLNTNLSWCGFYLGPAPSHPDPSWMPNRAVLATSGWGLAPVFLGQEIQGPGAHNANTDQGAIDGERAAALMTEAGFPDGSHVFLDLENGAPFTEPLAEYVRAWGAAVLAGGFTPDAYCSHALEAVVRPCLPRAARLWVFRVPTIARTQAASPFPTPDIAGSGCPDAGLWQRAQNVEIEIYGNPLTVDLSVSALADPSAP